MRNASLLVVLLASGCTTSVWERTEKVSSDGTGTAPIKTAFVARLVP